MNTNHLTYKDSNPWTWSKAEHTDVEAILDLVAENYQLEIDGILTANRPRMAYHLHKGILDQIFRAESNLITVAKLKQTNEVIAWAWLERGKFTVYADEEMAVAEFAHVKLDQSNKTKIMLIAQILEQWIAYASLYAIPVLCSTTIREDQAGFMRLHDAFGFARRGSFAYKRIC